MGDGEDESPVDQAQPVRPEARINAVAVRAVAIEQERRGAVLLESLAIDQRDRDVRAVAGLGVQPLGDVVLAIEPPEDLVLLLELL
jgi:hypothetical protein